MNECERYQEMICCLIDGELSKEDAEALMAHIALCPECKASYEAFSMVSAAVASDLEEVPEALHEGIMAGVRRSAVYENNKRGRDRRFKRIIAAVACFAIVVVSAVGLSRTLLERASDVAVDEEHVEAVQAPVDENGLAALPPETSADAGASAQASASPAVTASPAPSASAAAQATEDAYLSGGQDLKSTPAPTAAPSPAAIEDDEEEVPYSSGTTALDPLPSATAAPETASPSASDESSAQSKSTPAAVSETDGDADDSGKQDAADTAASAKPKRRLNLFPFTSSDESEAEAVDESAAAEASEAAETADESADAADGSEDAELLRAFKELFGIETEPEETAEPDSTAETESESVPESIAEAESESEADIGTDGSAAESVPGSSAGPRPEPDAVYDLTGLEDYTELADLLKGDEESGKAEAAELPRDKEPGKSYTFLMKYETLEIKLVVFVYGGDVFYSVCDDLAEAEEPAEPEFYLAACSFEELEEFLSSYEEQLLPTPSPSDCADDASAQSSEAQSAN